jgi:phosphoserine phosphatase RsbU/P
MRASLRGVAEILFSAFRGKARGNIVSRTPDLPIRIERFIAGETEKIELRLMKEISRKISTATDSAEVLNFILDSARKVVDYDAAAILLFDEESRTARFVAGSGYREDAGFEVSLANEDSIVGWVISTGECVIAAEVGQNPHYLNRRPETRSQLTVPITIDGKVIGAFNLESDPPDSFNDDDLEWLLVLATEVAISIDRANHRQELLERKRLDEELRIAREVQLSLLPATAPNLEGLDIAGINIPSRDIGGDYYDFIPIIDGHLGIVIADVVGKGVPASLIMASFRAFLRAEIRNNYAIRTVFYRVNNLLHEILKPHQFVTAFYGVFDLERRRFTFSNAGHNPPVLMGPDKECRQLGCGGTVLGLFEGTSYEEDFIDLAPGDLFVLYTDGLVEAQNKEGQMFGYQELARLVRANADLHADQLCETIYEEMRRFTGESHPEDDTTVVVAKLL